MAFNLVDLVKDQVSDQLLGQLAGAAGLDSNQGTAALGSALPGLLSGFAGTSNRPGGAGALLDAVNQQDDGLLGNLGAMLDQGQGQQLAEQGTGLLTSLLGNGALDTLTSVIGGMTGINKGGSASLLGLLAPIVLGVIKKQVLGGGLDAGGLTSLLDSQQANINAAMPAGLSDQLTSQGFFDSIAGGDTAASAPAAPDASHTPPTSSGGLPKWLIPAVVVAALVFVGLRFLGGKDVDVSGGGEAIDNAAAEFSSVTDGIATADLDAARAALPEGLDLEGLTGQLNGVFESTTSALSGITDADTATAALPQLTDASERVSRFDAVFKRLPDAAKGPFAGMLQNGLGAIQPLLDTAMAIPGVGSVIEPVVGPMIASISEMAGG